MSESRSHKIVAKRIAKKLKTDYNSKKGIDINTPKIAVEVETQGLVSEGIRQLQGYKKPSYIAAANQETLKEALEKTKRTTIGVMNPQGDIIKKTSRKKQ